MSDDPPLAVWYENAALARMRGEAVEPSAMVPLSEIIKDMRPPETPDSVAAELHTHGFHNFYTPWETAGRVELVQA